MTTATPFLVLHPVIGGPYETEYEEVDPVLGEAPKCPSCGTFVGMKPWLAPYRARIAAHGGAIGDIAIGVGGDLLVSEAFRRGWAERQLLGVEKFDPVDIVGVRPRRLASTTPTFHHLWVHRDRTSIDLRRSMLDLRREPTCSQCLGGGLIYGMHGFAIDEATWTGDDMFRPNGLADQIVVTERVRELADSLTLRNFNFTRVEDFMWEPTGRRGRGRVENSLTDMRVPTKDTCERLIQHWRSQDLQIAPGCSEGHLERFERRFSVRLPRDLRTCYARTNGMGPPGQDKKGFSIWSLDSIRPAVLALKEAGAHARPLGADNYYAFSDYPDWSWAYAIRLTSEPAENPVVLIGKEELEVVSQSFAEFIEQYLADAAPLYGR
jgi:hypothetical protein